MLNTFPLSRPQLQRLEGVDASVEIEHRPGDVPAAVADLADEEFDALWCTYLPEGDGALPGLRWVQLASAGADHLGDRAGRRGLQVTTASGVYSVGIAEYVLGAILEITQCTRERELWRRRERRGPQSELIGARVRGSRLTIVGYGGVGREVARLAAALGMEIVAVKARPDMVEHRGYREPGTGDPTGALPSAVISPAELMPAAAETDFMVVTVPLAPSTRGLIDAEVMAALPSHAWLINVGRGGVVDEGALASALSRSSFAGAVLDVVCDEPLEPDHPLWGVDGVVLTPHVASGRPQWESMTDLLARNLRSFLAGEPLLNTVRVEDGY